MDLFERVLEEIRARRGLDLRGYRADTLRKRLADRMKQVEAADLEIYLARLERDAAECDRLIGVLAVHVTSFFRDPLVFEVLEETVLPALLQEKRRRNSREFRVWCAGCGSGEEAYSIAILLDRARQGADRALQPLVFGTDVSADLLRRAEEGLYPREQLENVKLGILDRYFVAREKRFAVVPEVRAMVRFSLDDLTRPGVVAPAESIFGGFDLVLCRNLLIYFTRQLQEAVLDKLFGSLVPGGFLVLGSSEHLGERAGARLEVVDARNRIYRKPRAVRERAFQPAPQPGPQQRRSP